MIDVIEKSWSEMYYEQNQPSFEEISTFINNPLWKEMNRYLQDTYKIKPKLSYSKCSQQRGWNIKYQKSGKSLCTLYPMNGYFIALVVIGNKELNETELIMPSCCSYIQELFNKTPYSAMGRWLMINVTDKGILNDTEALIKIRLN